MGVAIFETIELRRAQPFALRRHVYRLRLGAEQLGLAAPDPEEVTTVARTVGAAWGPRPGRLRVTWSQHGDAAARLTLHAAPMTVRTDPTGVVTTSALHDERGATSGLKTAHGAPLVAAQHAAAARGAGEALLANTRGELCEGATSNLVVVLDGVVLTPPLQSGCLPGVTRALLLEAAADAQLELVERTIPIASLATLEELALVSTGRHLQPVRSIDGRALPTVDGPAIRSLRRAFHAAYADLDDP